MNHHIEKIKNELKPRMESKEERKITKDKSQTLIFNHLKQRKKNISVFNGKELLSKLNLTDENFEPQKIKESKEVYNEYKPCSTNSLKFVNLNTSIKNSSVKNHSNSNSSSLVKKAPLAAKKIQIDKTSINISFSKKKIIEKDVFNKINIKHQHNNMPSLNVIIII